MINYHIKEKKKDKQYLLHTLERSHSIVSLLNKPVLYHLQGRSQNCRNSAQYPPPQDRHLCSRDHFRAHPEEDNLFESRNNARSA